MKRIVPSLVGVVLALLTAELYVRPISMFRSSFEPGIGFVYGPGVIRHYEEGPATSHWEAHGQRRIPAQGDGPALLILGDSLTADLMVDDEATYTAVTQDRLNREGMRARVISCGLSGRSLADYIVLAPRYRELFAPAWTVIQIDAPDFEEAMSDDGSANHLAYSENVLTAVPVIPTAALSRAHAITHWLAEHSAAAGLGMTRLREVFVETEDEPPLFSQDRPAAPTSPPPPPIEAALDLLVAAWDRKLTVLFVLQNERTEGPTEARVLAYCEKAGLGCVSTRRAFDGLRALSVEPFGFSNTTPGTGHMNVDGNRAAGELLAAELVRARVLPWSR